MTKAKIFALLLAQLAFGQATPFWTDGAWRDTHYPPSEWYAGFSEDVLKPKDNAAQALKQLERDAQNKLAESIAVRISSKTAMESRSSKSHAGEIASEKYRQAVLTSANAEVAKAELRSHHDLKTGKIYAFAAVRQTDLANFYKSRMDFLFSSADKEFAKAELLTEQGKKKQALDKVSAAEDSLKSVEYWISLLSSVESGGSYLEKEKIFSQKAMSMKTQLQSGTAVYLDVSGDGGLDGLGAEMREKGCNCSIAEEKEDADFSVSVKSKLSRCEENSYGQVFCYANAAVSVNNLSSKKNASVKVDEAKGIWTKGNKDKAAEEAFKKLTKSIAEKINQTINQ
jgi:hypothetical protein